MLNALLAGERILRMEFIINLILLGKSDGISNKENHQSNSLRNLVNGWNEPSLLNKKSTSGLNLRQQKDSPFNEVMIKILRF